MKKMKKGVAGKLGIAAEIVGRYLGREELADWWRVIINNGLEKEANQRLTSRQFFYMFRILKKHYSVTSRRVYIGKVPFLYYKVGAK